MLDSLFSGFSESRFRIAAQAKFCALSITREQENPMAGAKGRDIQVKARAVRMTAGLAETLAF
jgi:hypothetical protein